MMDTIWTKALEKFVAETRDTIIQEIDTIQSKLHGLYFDKEATLNRLHRLEKNLDRSISDIKNELQIEIALLYRNKNYLKQQLEKQSRTIMLLYIIVIVESILFGTILSDDIVSLFSKLF